MVNVAITVIMPTYPEAPRRVFRSGFLEGCPRGQAGNGPTPWDARPGATREPQGVAENREPGHKGP